MGDVEQHGERVHFCTAFHPDTGAQCELRVPVEGGTHEDRYHMSTVWARHPETGLLAPASRNYWNDAATVSRRGRSRPSQAPDF